MDHQIIEEAKRILEEIRREDPVILERVLSRLGPDAYLIKYLLAKRSQAKAYA